MEMLLEFAQRNVLITLAALAAVVIVIGIVLDQVKAMVRSTAFEASRREIAAYVAEGSIKPEQAAALLALGPPEDKSKTTADAGKRLAELVAGYEVSTEDAAKLVAQRHEVDEAVFAQMVDLVAEGMGVDEAIKLARARQSGPALAGAAASLART
jgi:hypothetical protein